MEVQDRLVNSSAFTLTFAQMGNPLNSVIARVRGRSRYRTLRETPVVVGGCERSGTTLLLSVLSAHPSIHAIPMESFAFCYAAPTDLPTGSEIRMSRLYRCLGDGPLSPSAHRWAEKTPANVFHFGEILDHFGGDVRLIHIVRDGRDVVTSLHPSRPGEFWMKPNRWTAAVSAGLRYERAAEVLTIRYEDLVEDFDGTARTLCQHIGEPFPDEMREWWRHAQVRKSEHVRTGKIAPIFATSIRKFERPDFPFGDQVQKLIDEPGAVDLLRRFRYI